MKITTLGRLQFLVEGQEGIYHLDLEENNLNGKCDCAFFRCKIQPLLNKGDSPSVNTKCKHIRAVREKIADTVIRQLAEASKKPNK